MSSGSKMCQTCGTKNGEFLSTCLKCRASLLYTQPEPFWDEKRQTEMDRHFILSEIFSFSHMSFGWLGGLVAFAGTYLFFFGYLVDWFGFFGTMVYFGMLGLAMVLIVYPNIPKEKDHANLFWERLQDYLQRPPKDNQK